MTTPTSTNSIEDNKFVCPDCGGDGKETCHNPDHGFISAMGGELNRLGCPCCGHDENYKISKYVGNGKWEYNKCYTCDGTGGVTEIQWNQYCDENECDFEMEQQTT